MFKMKQVATHLLTAFVFGGGGSLLGFNWHATRSLTPTNLQNQLHTESRPSYNDASHDTNVFIKWLRCNMQDIFLPSLNEYDTNTLDMVRHVLDIRNQATLKSGKALLSLADGVDTWHEVAKFLLLPIPVRPGTNDKLLGSYKAPRPQPEEAAAEKMAKLTLKNMAHIAKALNHVSSPNTPKFFYDKFLKAANFTSHRFEDFACRKIQASLATIHMGDLRRPFTSKKELSQLDLGLCTCWNVTDYQRATETVDLFMASHTAHILDNDSTRKALNRIRQGVVVRILFVLPDQYHDRRDVLRIAKDLAQNPRFSVKTIIQSSDVPTTTFWLCDNVVINNIEGKSNTTIMGQNITHHKYTVERQQDVFNTTWDNAEQVAP